MGRRRAFLERGVARLKASNPQIEIITVAGAGHLMHGTHAHRSVYLDHLRRIIDRWAARGDAPAAGS